MTFASVLGSKPLNILAKTSWRERKELARVVVVGDRAEVWGVDGREPALRQTATVTNLQRDGRAYVVTTDEGETWRLVEGGCGCGSPLKRFRPALLDQPMKGTR